MKLAAFVVFIIAASAACVGSKGYAAAPVPAPEERETSIQARVPSEHAGLHAYIDPLTRRLAPVPEQPVEADLRASPLERDDSKMWTEPLEGGGLLLHTEGQIQMATMARIGADGALEATCGPAAHEPHSVPASAQHKQEPQK